MARTGEPGALGWSSWLESTFHNNEKDKDAIASSLHDMHEGSVQQVEPKQSLLKYVCISRGCVLNIVVGGETLKKEEML